MCLAVQQAISENLMEAMDQLFNPLEMEAYMPKNVFIMDEEMKIDKKMFKEGEEMFGNIEEE